MRLTGRDLEILDSLARKVRAFSIGQFGFGWWSDSKAPTAFAGRRLAQLADAGYVRQQLVHVSPMLQLNGPLVSWREGGDSPEFGALAWKLQSRWPAVAPEPTTVVFATPATNDMFGGPTSRPRFSSHHATHDLHVSQIYLMYCRTRPEDAAAWQGEDIREKSGYRLKDPDAVVERESGARPLVVEFGGRSYESTHLCTFHDDCVARGRDYELW